MGGSWSAWLDGRGAYNMFHSFGEYDKSMTCSSWKPARPSKSGAG
jgi:hypothetical protein